MTQEYTLGCGAPDQDTALPLSVRSGDEPVPGAYVRLLDATGEFTAEVVTSAGGQFRFFAAPGNWTLRALSRAGNGDATVSAERGLNQVAVTVTAA
ncbi:MAG: DUF1416 domain-containing protein [Actinobacteria bacterium]|nr:MAG: DUF1416 domain-containing protein [Actinomycetota bacterium]